jgi:hypothetical protein
VTEPLAPAPEPTYRLVPSKFPPIGLIDTVATAADMEVVLDLVGWTNDRLVAERASLLPRSEGVFGRPNSSVVMAAFLHVAPGGMRFNNNDVGAWYAAAETVTAIAEVAHHLRREAVATGLPTMSRTYRCYLADLAGTYVDLRERGTEMPEIFATDSYAESQRFGETVRATDNAGILYASVRRTGGLNIVGYRPSLILNVRQGDHFEITVQAADRHINVKTLSATH